jgi:hypothetical protein
VKAEYGEVQKKISSNEDDGGFKGRRLMREE